MMRIKQKVTKAVETILAGQSQLEIADIAKLIMTASYDNEGHINKEGLQALVYVGQHYQESMSGLCRVVFQETLNSIPENSKVYVPDGGKAAPPKQQPKPKPKSSPQPAPAKPKPAPPPTVNCDPRLVGVFEYSKYISAAGYSYSSAMARAFRANGRFVESGEDPVPPDKRGTWKTNGSVLRLDWDNNYYAVYKYEVGREGMLLTPIDPPGGETKYWQRKS